MHSLNIAFDGRSAQELKEFISGNRDTFSSKNVQIKLNDLIALIGIEGVKKLEKEIQSEI
jgi:hypothetical protein